MTFILYLLFSLLLSGVLAADCDLFRSEESGVLKIHYQCGVNLPPEVLPPGLLTQRRGAATTISHASHMLVHLRRFEAYRKKIKWQGVFSGFDSGDFGYIGGRIETIPGDGPLYMQPDAFDGYIDGIINYLEDGGRKTCEVHFVDNAFAMHVDELGAFIRFPSRRRRDGAAGVGARAAVLTEHRGGTFCDEPFDVRKYFAKPERLGSAQLHFAHCPGWERGNFRD